MPPRPTPSGWACRWTPRCRARGRAPSCSRWTARSTRSPRRGSQAGLDEALDAADAEGSPRRGRPDRRHVPRLQRAGRAHRRAGAPAGRAAAAAGAAARAVTGRCEVTGVGRSCSTPYPTSPPRSPAAASARHRRCSARRGSRKMTSRDPRPAGRRAASVSDAEYARRDVHRGGPDVGDRRADPDHPRRGLRPRRARRLRPRRDLRPADGRGRGVRHPGRRRGPDVACCSAASCVRPERIGCTRGAVGQAGHRAVHGHVRLAGPADPRGRRRGAPRRTAPPARTARATVGIRLDKSAGDVPR